MLSDWKYLVGGTIGAVGMLALCLVWYEGVPFFLDGRIDVVRREARADLVSKTELAAAQAQAAEYRRQVEAGATTIKNFEQQLAIARRAASDREEESEREIRAYEVRLQAAGRSCLLDGDDIEWMRKPR